MPSRKESRAEQLFVYSLVVAFLCAMLLFTYAVITTAEQARSYTTPPPEPRDWRPDITHCHDDKIDLWDCIRKPGMYRTDI